MSQTTSVKIISRERSWCRKETLDAVLAVLGSEPRAQASMHNGDRWVRWLSPDEIQNPFSLLKGKIWILLGTENVPPRIQRFIQEIREEDQPSLLPSRFFGETSIWLGPHQIEGQTLGGKEAKPFISWLSVSFYCEETPTDWAGFEEEFRNSKATLELLADLQAVIPSFELSIRYFT